jgi:hypothetical protein
VRKSWVADGTRPSTLRAGVAENSSAAVLLSNLLRPAIVVFPFMPVPVTARIPIFILIALLWGGLWGQAPAQTPLVTAPTRAPGTVPSAAALNAQRNLARLPTVYAPTRPRLVTPRYPWKTGIVTTVFWIGEGIGPTGVGNRKSSWDTSWQESYGGFDTPDPSARVDFRPKAFEPKLNPFYFALPFNDKTNPAIASTVIPWFKTHPNRYTSSVCRGVWIAIRFGRKTCYAQWDDVGPWETDDWSYVFGSSPQPRNKENNSAGLDISPACRYYLTFPSGARCDWRFCDVTEVPDGPWRSRGNNNPFAKEQEVSLTERTRQLQILEKKRLDWLRAQRNPYFPSN